MAGAAERIFPAAPIVTGGGRILPSPAQFYLTGEDRLRVVSSNAQPGVTIKVQARIATPAGETKPESWDHTPTTDRTVTRQDFELGAGSLLNVTVFATSGGPRVGQTFLMVQLVRGMGAAAIVLGTLLAGYVTTTQALGWPGSPIASSIAGGGYLRRIVGTQPAAGVEIAETVPSGARWQLLAAGFTLTTSAVAGNRQVRVFLQKNAGNVSMTWAPIEEGPGTQRAYVFEIGVPYTNQVSPGNDCVAPLPAASDLLAGDVWGTAIGDSNIQAGDQYTAPVYLVREWLEVS